MIFIIICLLVNSGTVFDMRTQKSTSAINNILNDLIYKHCLHKIPLKSPFLINSLQISEGFLFCYDLCQDLCKVSILKSFIMLESAQFFAIQNLTLLSNYCTCACRCISDVQVKFVTLFISVIFAQYFGIGGLKELK